MDIKHPHEAVLTEWAHWTDEAVKEHGKHKPSVTMCDIEAPKGYAAQFCVRKNLDKSRPKYLDYIARGIIVNAKTASVVFDSGNWVKINEARKKLDAALAQLGSIQKP